MDPLSLLADARPVFILSTARSGSTLLRLTLGKLPAVVSLPESHLLRFREDHAGADLSTPSGRESIAAAWIRYHRIRKWPVDHERLRADVAEHATTWRRLLELSVVRYVEDVVPGTPSRFLWCEKSPPHVFRRDELRAAFPGAHFLHLIRDPRDVAASLKTCPWATSNVYVSARVWERASREVTEAPDTHRVHYERLVAEPEPELRRICEFLDLTFDPECIASPTVDAVEARNVRSHASLEPISKRYTGIWRERLSKPDRDVEVIQHVCGESMDRLGYERGKERRDVRFRTRLALGWLGLAAQRLVDR